MSAANPDPAPSPALAPQPELASASTVKPTNVARSAGVVGIAVMCSRVLGLVRELVFAALFGANAATDAFTTAFRAPNLLRDLFAEGALSTAFVTTFSKKIQTEGDQSAWCLASKVATLTTVFMSAVTLLGVLFAPYLIGLLAPGFNPAKAELTILLTRIMFPFILLVSLAALVMGMLNAKNVFGMPAMASSFFNLGSIIGGVGIGYLLDPTFGTQSLIGLAIGTLVGGFLQFAVQLPSLRKVGFRFTPDFRWRDEGVRTVLLLMGPAVIAASAVQVNVMVNTIFASFLQDGSQTWLNYAFRLMQLPLGLFGVAVGTVTLPVLSRIAATGARGEFAGTLAKSLRLALLMTVPAAAGLMFMSEPIIRLIFERGRFDHADTIATAGALQFYAIGLVAYSGIKVVTPAFYAMDKRHAPMLVSLASILLTAALNFVLTFVLDMGHRGLALSTGIVAVTNFIVLYVLMRRATGKDESGEMPGFLMNLTVATLGLVGAAWAGNQWLNDVAKANPPILIEVLHMVIVVGLAAGLFFVVAWQLRIAELTDVIDGVVRRVRRSRSKPA